MIEHAMIEIKGPLKIFILQLIRCITVTLQSPENVHLNNDCLSKSTETKKRNERNLID